MAIRKVIYFILDSLDGSQKCASIFCDLSKAFDCLRHDILLMKLEYYGFSGKEINMMRTYLQTRSQVVTVNGQNSEVGKTNIGVPQGSILGPVLFLVYVNDLVNCLPEWTYVSLFADDTHLGIRANCDLTLDNKKQLALGILKEWFEANGIVLNAEKSICMKYSVRKGMMQNVAHVENVFLGYTIDYTICHTAHITKLCKKLSSANYALYKLKPLIDRQALISVYYAYIHSLINYAITVWGNAADVNKVLKSQKRAIRIICGLRRRSSARNYFVKYKILTVISLYIYNCLIEIHNNKENMVKNMDRHKYNLRNKEKLFQPMTRLVKVKKQGVCNKILMYNKLPISITKLNNTQFKRKIKPFFELNPFYTLNEFMEMRISESSFLYEDID